MAFPFGGQFWTDGSETIITQERLQLAISQNFHFLEIAGESCFLFRRKKQEDIIQTVATTATSGSFPDPVVTPAGTDNFTGFPRFSIWNETLPDTKYPDLRNLKVFVNDEEIEQVFFKTEFEIGEAQYAIDEFKDEIDFQTGNPLTDEVFIILNSPPFDTDEDELRVEFSSISRHIDLDSMQPRRLNHPEGRSLYGYEQYFQPNTVIRGANRPHSILIAFPDVQRDFTVINAGLQIESRVTHWTSPPPLMPFINEHDVIIRQSNNLRYEIVNKTDSRLGDFLVQQQFDVVEFNQDDPAFELVERTIPV